MNEYKWITRENIPCWYELSWREKEPAIILRVHRDFIESAPIPASEHPLVATLMQNFKFRKFSGDLRNDFGFDSGIFKNQGKQEDGFFEYITPIPRIKIITKNPCKECEGTGKDLRWQKRFREDIKCHNCGGSGLELAFNWPSAHAVSASFTVFFILSLYPDNETSCSFPQLMTVETITGTDMWHGGSLGGEFSIPLIQWLASIYQNVNTTIPEVIEAEKIAYSHMFQDHDDRYGFRYGFRAYVGGKEGGLVIDCPGDACGIHPDTWNIEKGQGYKFSCHNVDSAAQQITLLAGLAALHDRARKEIRSY